MVAKSNELAVQEVMPPASMNKQHTAVMDLMLRGNLKGLSDEQIMQVYIARCDSMGIDARTKPFDLLDLGGGLQLYPNARLADQLIDKHGLSVEVLSEETIEDLYRVRVKVSDGVRVVHASAALPVKGCSGEKLGNAWMKCETKAVRRGVLRFCGLGAQPTAQQEEERRKHGLRVVHAMGAERGLQHEQIRAIAQEHYAIESMTELDADDLADLSDAIEAQLAIARTVDDEPVDYETGEILDAEVVESEMHPMVQEAIDNREANWIAAMEGAATMAELSRIGTEIASASISEQSQASLRGIWNKQRDRLQSTDRHTS